MKPEIAQQVLGFAAVELNPRPLLFKFYSLQILGAAATLLICPQFGIGGVDLFHGLTHALAHHAAWLCGAFCGGLFLLIGTGLSVVFLSRPQWQWVWRHQFLLVVPPVVLGFTLLMGLKTWGGFEAPHESWSYNLAWMVAAMLAAWAALGLRRTLSIQLA
jgi:hypothetical protein